MLRYFPLLLSCFLLFQANAQLNATSQLASLMLPTSARQAALGGSFITQRDNDLSSVGANPALLNEKQSGKFVLNSTFIPSGAKAGGLQYAFKPKKYFQSAAQFRFLSSGVLNRTSVEGLDMGHFSANDFAFTYGASRSLNARMSIGAAFNFLYSQLEAFSALGAAIDLGGHYTDPNKRIDIAGTIRNVGFLFKSYSSEKGSLPLNVQLAISHKLEHAPFRFTLLANQLQRWDLTYMSTTAPKKDPLTGELIEVKEPSFFNKLARHAVIQTELLLGEKIHLRFAFDYNRRKSLRLVERGGLAGFSLGAGARFKRFSIDYGFLVYSVAGSQQFFTLSIPFQKNNSK